MDYASLKLYIENDPIFTNYILNGNDQQITDIINQRTLDKISIISRQKFAIWCGVTGLRAAIEDHANDLNSPLRSIALTIRDFLYSGGWRESIDFSDVSNIAMLDAWIAAGVITQTQKTDLLQLSTEKVPVFGRLLTNTDVAIAFGRNGFGV